MIPSNPSDGLRNEIYSPRWYWAFLPIAAIGVSVFLIFGALAVSDITKEAFMVLLFIGVGIFVLGITSLVILLKYRITLCDHILTVSCIGMRDVIYDLSNIVGLRKRGFYITLDYGSVPRSVILSLPDNRQLFSAIERHASTKGINALKRRS